MFSPNKTFKKEDPANKILTAKHQKNPSLGDLDLNNKKPMIYNQKLKNFDPAQLKEFSSLDKNVQKAFSEFITPLQKKFQGTNPSIKIELANSSIKLTMEDIKHSEIVTGLNHNSFSVSRINPGINLFIPEDSLIFDDFNEKAKQVTYAFSAKEPEQQKHTFDNDAYKKSCYIKVSPYVVIEDATKWGNFSIYRSAKRIENSEQNPLYTSDSIKAAISDLIALLKNNENFNDINLSVKRVMNDENKESGGTIEQIKIENKSKRLIDPEALSRFNKHVNYVLNKYTGIAFSSPYNINNDTIIYKISKRNSDYEIKQALIETPETKNLATLLERVVKNS